MMPGSQTSLEITPETSRNTKKIHIWEQNKGSAGICLVYSHIVEELCTLGDICPKQEIRQRRVQASTPTALPGDRALGVKSKP